MKALLCKCSAVLKYINKALHIHQEMIKRFSQIFGGLCSGRIILFKYLRIYIQVDRLHSILMVADFSKQHQ